MKFLFDNLPDGAMPVYDFTEDIRDRVRILWYPWEEVDDFRFYYPKGFIGFIMQLMQKPLWEPIKSREADFKKQMVWEYEREYHFPFYPRTLIPAFEICTNAIHSNKTSVTSYKRQLGFIQNQLRASIKNFDDNSTIIVNTRVAMV